MKKRITILIILFLCFYSNLIYSQHSNIINGIILDSLSNKPIAGVSISTDNYTTLSDLNGRFKIKFLDTHNFIKFSHIGFQIKTQKFPLTNFLEIKLKPQQNKLNDIQLKTNIFSLILKAIEKIPINYNFNNQTVLTGVFKQDFTKKHIKDTSICFIQNQESLVDYKYPAYNNPFVTTEVNFLTNQHNIYYSDSISYKQNITSLGFGLQDIIDADFVLRKKSFIQKNAYKYYVYQSNGIKDLFGRKVIEINFYSKKSKNKMGTLFIDTATYAFVACNYYQYNGILMEYPLNYKMYNISYSIDSNNKWSLNNVYVETDYKNNNNLKEYFFKKTNEVYTNNSKIKFEKMKFLDFENKITGSDSLLKIKDLILEHNKKGYINNYTLIKDTLKLENNLKKVDEKEISKEVNKIKLLTYFLNDDNSRIILYSTFNKDLFLKKELININILTRLKIIYNFYIYAHNSFSLSLSNFSYSDWGWGFGYKIPFKKSKNFDCLFMYSGYELQKYETKGNIIYAQGNIIGGINIETKLANKLNLLIDLKQTILPYKNYNNIVPQSNNKFFAGVGISFKF